MPRVIAKAVGAAFASGLLLASCTSGSTGSPSQQPVPSSQAPPATVSAAPSPTDGAGATTVSVIPISPPGDGKVIGSATLHVSDPEGGDFDLVAREADVQEAAELIQRTWLDPAHGVALGFYQNLRDPRHRWSTNQLHPVTFTFDGHPVTSNRGECVVRWQRPTGGSFRGSLTCRDLKIGAALHEVTATFESKR